MNLDLDGDIGMHRNPTKLNIISFALAKEEPFNTQYIHSFSTSGIDDSNIGNLVTRTEKFQRTDAATLNSVAFDVLKPSISDGVAANIDNGWGETRFKYNLIVDMSDSQRRRRMIITGYTDKFDISHMGNVDPNMRFYVNDVLEVMDNDMGSYTHTRVVDSFQLLRNTATPSHNRNGTNNATYTLRPTDVVEHISGLNTVDEIIKHQALVNQNNPGHRFDIGDTVVDTRQMLGSGIGPGGNMHRSKRENLNAAKYLSKVITGYNQAVHESHYASSDMSIYDDAAKNIGEQYVAENPVLKMLIDGTSFNSLQCFTLKELNDVCVEDATRIMKVADSAPIPQELTNGNLESLNAIREETEIATVITNLMSSFASELTVTRMGFVATNATLTGEIVVNLTDDVPVASLSNGHLAQRQLDMFMLNIKTVLMPAITHQNQSIVEVYVNFDLFGRTYVTVSLEGRPPVPYAFASFMDAAVSPILSPKDTNLATMASDFQFIFEKKDDIDAEERANGGQSHATNHQTDNLLTEHQVQSTCRYGK